MRARVALVAMIPAAVLVARSAPAAAQSACLGGQLEPVDILLPNDAGDDFVQKSEPDIIDFFNLAHCVCPEQFAAEFQLTGGDTTMTEEGQIWVGTDCDAAMDLATREEQCLRLDPSFTDVVTDIDTPQKYPINAADLMFPNSPTCEFETVNRGVYLLVDDDNTNDAVFLCKESTSIAIDTEAPPQATEPRLLPGEGSAVIQWSPPTSRADDVEFFQVLCMRDGGSTEADDFPRDDAEYQTASSLCGADDGTTLEDLSDGTTTSPFGELDPDTVCGTATGTDVSIQVGGLENGVAYHIALLQVDDARNVSGSYLGTVVPQPVKDFWEDYHDKGGTADGGLCLGVSEGGSGSGSALIILGAIMFTLLPRRRGALVAGAGALALLLATTGAASAQGYDPYWERWDDEAETVQETIPHWSLNFKGGPYRPRVDDEFDMLGPNETPPFAAMFGTDDNFFGVVELERYFLFPMGQLGAYGSIGLTSQRADAFQVDADGNVIIDEETMLPVRAPGNRVIFRLVPMSLGAVYRFTELDDRFRVPIVPYGKLGLTYGLWWVRAPNGSLSRAPTPDCPDPEGGTCGGDKALGASLGWQATIGLAIRAERIDPQSAQNLRNEMGIEHAGFFAELMYAKVDHFGSDTRLNVGDATWLVGINFEF
jgi:hypothetical protein